MAEWLHDGRRRWLWVGGFIVLVVAAFAAWRMIWPRESTDDAQVSGHVSPISARVGGTVTAVHVHDNQAVKAGDVLVELDPHDYQIALDRAQADLAAAEAAARAARTGVPIETTTTTSTLNVAQASTTSAEAALHAADRDVDAAKAKLVAAHARVAEATANATRAAQDLARLQPLAAKDEVSKQQLDAATAAAAAASASVDSAQASVTEAKANIDAATSHRAQAASALEQARAETRGAATGPQQVALTEAHAQTAEAQVQQARAAVEQAQLNLDRSTLRAPVSGVVSRKSIEVGQLVQAGQTVLALTSLDDVWVTANFKETQLGEMHAGQRAVVTVDAFGGRTFTGHVDSLAAATGSTFSLLPPENATGNFVKVVQRIPVKILLDGPPSDLAGLRPGMSVDATVYLK